MAAITAFIDLKGHMFKTPKETVLSNLSIVFGDSQGSLAFAKSILDNRERVEAVLKEYDEDVAHSAQIIQPEGNET